MHLWFVNSVVSSSELEDETTADDDDDERKKHNITKHKVHFLKACCVAVCMFSSCATKNSANSLHLLSFMLHLC